MAPKNQKRKLVYFRPGQITCLATHRQDTVTDDDLNKWKEEMEKFLGEWRITRPPRAFSFRAPSEDERSPSKDQAPRLEGAFSIIFCDVENEDDDPRSLLKLVERLDRELRNKELAGLTVQAVSPNWLASSTPDGGAVGGPGSWPVPFRGMPSRAPYHFPQLLSDLHKAGLYGEGDEVDVAILDTAPSPHDLVAAHKECKDWHPLIRTLLGPDGQLRLYPATYGDLLRMGSTSMNEHDYKMTDHGLFAAGIVHTIAPRATIHLIEVLNAHGVGDLESIAGGLRKVYEEIYQEGRRQGRRLVVSCSLMLELPLMHKHCYAERDRGPDFDFEQAILRMVQDDPNPHESKRLAFALKGACDRLDEVGRPVIAAAGNDWRDKSVRRDAPKARYPAAFNSAVGIGALPKDSKPDPKTGKHAASSYSNLADMPESIGITTLGGEPGEGQGVLGLYLGEFPGCEPNCTKWAWWAGTSFATPILTGAIAAVFSSPKRPRTTQDAIDELRGAGIITDDQTPAGEDALHTTQDYAAP